MPEIIKELRILLIKLKETSNYFINMIRNFLTYCSIIAFSFYTIGCKNKIATNDSTGYDQNKKSKSSCEIVESNIKITKNNLILNQLEGKWYYNNQPYTGYAVTYHLNGIIEEKMGYCSGKKEGISQKWYPDGSLRKQSYYKQNKVDGVQRNWWKNGVLSSEGNYKNGVKHGIQKKWFVNGQLGRKTNYNNGKPEGLQQSWLQNGKLYVNYEVKNGRTFGLKRANLCYALEKEKIQYQ